MVPLSLVLFVSLVKEAFEDWVSTAVFAHCGMHSFVFIYLFGLGFFKETLLSSFCYLLWSIIVGPGSVPYFLIIPLNHV